MFRSPLGRNLALRQRATRRLLLVLSLFTIAASVPFINAGARRQEEEVGPRKSAVAPKGQANVVEGAEFVPGEVLVRFRSDAAAKRAEVSPHSLRATDGGEATFLRFEGSDMVRGLRLAKVEASRTLEAVAELAERSDVLYAEPNYIWRVKRTPNDPRFGEQQGLTRINAPAAWDTTVGSRNVVVGVLDGGVDINHPDLKNNIWTNPGEAGGAPGADDDNNGYVDDINGWDFDHNDSSVFDDQDGDDHATHVAGTIGAQGDNAVGVTGVNWEVSIMSLKVLGPDGGSVSNIIEGYQYALQMRQRGVNMRVLNNSYGGPGRSLAALDAINQLNAAGILFVTAAGNGGGDSLGDDNFSFPDYPSNYDAPNVLAVAATDSNDQLATFSNFSSRLVSMGAPGGAILSTVPVSQYPSGYAYFGGTSMASPHVAGSAALVLSVRPDLPLANLRGVLAFTGDRLPDVLDGKTTTGRRLNVAKAMASALEGDGTAPAPAGNLRVTGQSGRNVTLAWTAPGDDDMTGAAADYDLFFVNPTTQARILLPTSLAPAPAGSEQTVAVNVPFRNLTGTIQLRTYDNAGNSSLTSVAVSLPVSVGTDPYTVALSAAQPLSTGGSNLFPAGGDDKYQPYTLPTPFTFPFYGAVRKSLVVSTNGALYFSEPPRRSNDDADDAGSSSEGLQGQSMIAGLWDDIDLRTCMRSDSGVYVSQPDATSLVFRWQGVPFSLANCPAAPLSTATHVNFEIELRTDGTIRMRYGQNAGMFSVVGISGGEPDAYVVASHTSETQRINLSNAQTVTFSPRVPTFTVGGRVTEGGNGLGGVTVTLSGSLSATTTTDSGGNYSFANLTGGGNYGLTPSKAGYNFNPSGFSLPSLASDATVNFTAALNNSVGPNSVALTQASMELNEGDGRASFTVTRSGDTSGVVTVDYGTSDSDSFTVGCADAANNNGRAFARCDFANTTGRLSFVPGELNKTIIIPLIDDGHDENSETFQLHLSNPTGTGTALGGPNVATITIQDNDTGATPNPILTVSSANYSFFVRQQYLDFLSREPEPNEPWTAVMNRCADVNTGPATNTDCDRIAVSRAFFESPEFNLKGFSIFRFYKVGFNRLPHYTEIVSDMSFVAGATAAEVFARKAQLTDAFVARPEFVAAYGKMSNADFVAALLGRYSLTSITTPDPLTPDSGTRVTLSNSDLTGRLNANLLTRAQVFRAIADSDQLQAIEFNSAFVAMQYYGYLRRTPEAAGYEANLNALQRGTSRREMINGFLNSTEYRLRFGQP